MLHNNLWEVFITIIFSEKLEFFRKLSSVSRVLYRTKENITIENYLQNMIELYLDSVY